MSKESSQEVINTSDDRFETDVMIRSQLGLVLVDFWAEWCAPCRMLAPILEKLADEYQGRFTLVKANTDQTPQSASKFSVAGIPAVFAVLDEKVIESFQGVLPEPALREWLDRCLSAEALFRVASMVESEPTKAEEELRKMLEANPSDVVKVELLKVLHAQGKAEETREVLNELEQRGFLEPECERIKAKLEIESHADNDLQVIEKLADEKPDDLNLQYNLAEALAGAGEYERAFQSCLKLIERDRTEFGERARVLMVDMFRVLGDEAELTREYRRKLSMVLY